MLEFIFTTILMVSIGAMLYLMVRALPRVTEDPAEERNFLDRWAHSEIPEKVDEAMNGFLLKFLRKFKIGVLKLDNVLSAHLRKIKSEEEEKKAGIDFSDIAAAKENEEMQHQYSRRSTDEEGE